MVENQTIVEKRKDLMLEVMMDSMILLMIGSRLIGLSLQGSVFSPFYAERYCLLISKQMTDNVHKMKG